MTKMKRPLCTKAIAALILFPCFAPPTLFAAEHDMHFTANMTQASFDNWEQGGEDAMSWQTDLDEKSLWKSESYKVEGFFHFAYGRTRLGDSGYRKSVDELKTGLTASLSKNLILNPFFSAELNTQLSKGYIYSEESGVETRTLVSEFFSPGTTTESAGIGMEFKQVFSSRLGLAAKQTFSKDSYGWADDPETAEVETLRSEAGLNLDNRLTLALSEQVELTSQLKIFSAMGPFDEIDVDWDTSLKASVGKGFSVGLSVYLLRDADISRRRQLKENLSIAWSTQLF
jgi:hypothetical protein